MSTPPDSYYESLHSRPLLVSALYEPKNSIVKKILLDDPATANWVPQKNGEPTAMNTRAEHAALLNALKLTAQCNSITEIVSRTIPEGHSANFIQGFHRQVFTAINGETMTEFNLPSKPVERDAYQMGIEYAKFCGFDDTLQEVCNAQSLPRDMRMPE